jgi:ParB/RepB/Spo0J family partition protein
MKVKLTKLTHHPKNKDIYNLSDIDDLVQSIKEVGLLQPLIIDQQFQIISGNRRFEAIKQLGWEEVEVDQRDVKEEDEKYLLVQYNKQRVKTYRELLNEYQVLQKYYKIGQGKRTDLTSVRANKSKKSSREKISEEIGMSSSSLGKLLFVNKHEPNHIDLLDKGILTINQSYLQVSREIKEKKSRENNLDTPTEKLTDDDFVFYQKSSKSMVEISDGKIQTIFTSPPYWNKRQYSNEKGLGNEKTSDEFVENLINHLGDCYRVLNKKGSFFLNLGDTFLDGNLQNVPHKVVIGLQTKGWILRNTIIWSKTNPKPSSSKSNLTSSYEYIFHLVKSNDYNYYPTLTPLKKNTKASLPPRHRTPSKETQKSMSPYIPNVSGKNMGDYWSEDIVRTAVSNQTRGLNTKEHPAPFPENIVKLPILQTTKERDIILDPFCGRGTTGKVCRELNRKFVGYDVSNFL